MSGLAWVSQPDGQPVKRRESQFKTDGVTVRTHTVGCTRLFSSVWRVRLARIRLLRRGGRGYPIVVVNSTARADYPISLNELSMFLEITLLTASTSVCTAWCWVSKRRPSISSILSIC